MFLMASCGFHIKVIWDCIFDLSDFCLLCQHKSNKLRFQQISIFISKLSDHDINLFLYFLIMQYNYFRNNVFSCKLIILLDKIIFSWPLAILLSHYKFLPQTAGAICVYMKSNSKLLATISILDFSPHFYVYLTF